MNSRALLGALALVVASFGCVDANAPTGVQPSRAVTLAATPTFVEVPSASVVELLDVGRLRLIDVENDSLVASFQTAFDPSQEEWAVEVTLQLLQDQELDLRLDVEFVDTDPPVEVVEFSGRTSFAVRASFEPYEIREISLGRGPFANLSLTELRLGGARSNVQEGASDVLSVDTTGAAPGQIVYFESTSPEVATVDSQGAVSALSPGSTLLIAAAGRVADTLDLTVGEVILPPPEVLESWLLPHFEYVTGSEFGQSLSDQAATVALQEALTVLLDEMLAGRGPEAVGRFETAEELWASYGAGTDLRLLEAPQLSVIEVTLAHAADALGIDFR